MPGPVWLASGSSFDAARREVPCKRPVRGRRLVRTLGCELRLWNERCAARTRNGFAQCKRILQACGELAEDSAKARRQLRRIAAELRRTGDERAGKQHAFANGMGFDWLDGRSGCRRSGHC